MHMLGGSSKSTVDDTINIAKNEENEEKNDIVSGEQVENVVPTPQPIYSAELERSLVRKIDFRLIPLVFSLCKEPLQPCFQTSLMLV